MKTQQNSDQILLEFKALVQIVQRLRGPDGCPWDKEQTQKSLIPFAVEEAYELADAIQKQDQKNISEELGDYLFQVILQAQVAEDEKHFDLLEVIQKINRKMIYRHPHVFSNEKAGSIEDIWKKWEQLKDGESEKAKPIFNLPKGLPALSGANKIGVKSRNYGFDWNNRISVLAKIDEEVGELKQALAENNPKEIEHEIGDVLFSVAQLARHCEINPETALSLTNQRFQNRFNKMLQISQLDKSKWKDLPDEMKESLWQQAKDFEKQNP